MFEFWLKNETKAQTMLLPVTPGEWADSFGREVETVRATEKGDVNVLGKVKPQSPQISGFFNARDYSFARDSTIGADSAMAHIEILKGWIRDGDIIRVIIADDAGTKVNEQYYIEDLDFGQKMEDNGDIPYTLHLRQYVPMNVTTIEKSGTDNAARADTAAIPPKSGSYTVKKGDCLSAIARAVYGDAGKWRKIYEANKDIIGGNPNLIYPGQNYVIPQ